jgi:Fis family transcriptional regulator
MHPPPARPHYRAPAGLHSSGEEHRVNRMAARKDNASLVKRSQPAGAAAGHAATANGAARPEQSGTQRDKLREPGRPHRVPPVVQSAERPAEQAGESLEQCVFRSLDQYFSDLAGAKPHALHEMVLGAIEKPLLQFALQRCEGNQSAAADLLGINRNTLRRKLQDYGLH